MINASADFTDKEKADLVAFLKALCARSRSVTIWMPGCDNTLDGAGVMGQRRQLPFFRAADCKRRH
jgi:hypothetical protein